MRPRTLAVGCGIAVLVVVLIGGCGVLAAISSLPSGEHPDVDFHAPEISAAREAKLPELEAELAGVEVRFGARHLGPLGRVDRCESGQDNFTRQDTYAYACRMYVFQLLPLRDPVGADVSRLGESLLAGACPDGTETDRHLARHGGDPELLLWSSGDCTSGASMGGPDIVTVIPARPPEHDVQSVEAFLRTKCEVTAFDREYCKASSPDVRAAAAAASPGTAMLAVVVASDAYYLIPWECPWPASWFRDTCGGDAVVR